MLGNGVILRCAVQSLLEQPTQVTSACSSRESQTGHRVPAWFDRGQSDFEGKACVWAAGLER